MNHELVWENVILDVLVDGTQDQVVLERLSLFLADLSRLVRLIFLAIITQVENANVKITGAVDQIFAIFLLIKLHCLPFHLLVFFNLNNLVRAS